MNFSINELAWEKMQGLIPAIVQDAKSNAVLMLGYMNQEALQQTLETKWLTFYSRSKQRLWMKGETSGNRLQLVEMTVDCDNDTLLIRVNPTGSVCHTGAKHCFGETKQTDWEFIQRLEAIIEGRKANPSETSYTSKLFASGLSRMAQKVGEEGVEVVIASLGSNDQEFCGEVADLWFHTMVLLRARDLTLDSVIEVLRQRHIDR